MSTINTITKTLSIAPDGIPTVMRLSQNENGRQLVFELSDEVPGGSTVVLAGTKPDGHVYSVSGTISGNTATFDEDIQLTAVAGYWDAKVVIMNGTDTVATGRVKFIIDPDTVDPGSIPSDSQLDSLVAQAQAYAEIASEYAYGAPLAAVTAADMTDHDQVYIYVGSEAGYTAGDWYYWNGSSWVSGGQYGSGTMTIDSAMSNFSTNPVQNKVVNAAILNAIASIPITNNDDGGWGLAVYDHPYSTREWVGMEWEHWDTQDLDVDYVPTLTDGNGDPSYSGKIKSKYLPSASSSQYGAVKLDSVITEEYQNYNWYGAVTRDNNGSDETIYFPQLVSENQYGQWIVPDPDGVIRAKYLPQASDTDRGIVILDDNLDTDSNNAINNSTVAYAMPTSASVSNTGLITFKNQLNQSVFTLQLPIYNGGVS